MKWEHVKVCFRLELLLGLLGCKRQLNDSSSSLWIHPLPVSLKAASFLEQCFWGDLGCVVVLCWLSTSSQASGCHYE